MQQCEAGTNKIEAVTEAKISDSEAVNSKKDEQNEATISELGRFLKGRSEEANEHCEAEGGDSKAEE
eukprot:5227778-Alexandrium_andersonii.AAC.1